MKRLMGKTDVEDAFERLDTLTKEENLMTAARTFEATHRVDNKVTVIEEVLQELGCDVRADVDVIKEGTRNVDDNVKVTKRGTPIVTVSVSL
jgi:hypothetical protein